MYHRNSDERLRRLERGMEDGDPDARYRLLREYKKRGKFKNYLKLLSTIRPLNFQEEEELIQIIWDEILQQARISEAQNKIDEDVLLDALSFAENGLENLGIIIIPKTGLERTNAPDAGILCQFCNEHCTDYDGDRANLVELVRFIRDHKDCVAEA